MDETKSNKDYYLTEQDAKFQASGQIKIHTLTLKFSDEQKEDEFRRKLHNKSKRLTRITLFLLILFFLAMFPADRLLGNYSQEKINQRDIIKCIQLPIVVIWLYLTHLEKFEKHYITFTMFATFVIGVLGIAISIVGEEPDHGPHMLNLFVCWLFVRLPYSRAVLVCWPIFLTYAVAVPISVDNAKS